MGRILFFCWLSAIWVALIAFAPQARATKAHASQSVNSTSHTVTREVASTCSAHEFASMPASKNTPVSQSSSVEPAPLGISCAQKLSSLLGLPSSKTPQDPSVTPIFSSKQFLLLPSLLSLPQCTFRIINFEIREVGQPRLGFPRQETRPPKNLSL